MIGRECWGVSSAKKPVPEPTADELEDLPTMEDYHDTYQCEQCGADVPETEAETETKPGARGHTVTLAFCPDCTTEEC